MVTFKNPVSIKVLDGDTREVKQEWNGENAISDDVLCAYGQVFYTNLRSGNGPICFLLPDGGNWTGFTYNRQEPYAPYCISANNYLYPSEQTVYQQFTTYTPPSNNVTGQHKFFYEWNNLPTNIQLKAIGLTGWQSNLTGGNLPPAVFGLTASQPIVLIPQTLVILPTSILVHGYNGGATTPDVLEVSYFLSVVGAS
jgi:hypothetical protein